MTADLDALARWHRTFETQISSGATTSSPTRDPTVPRQPTMGEPHPTQARKWNGTAPGNYLKRSALHMVNGQLKDDVISTRDGQDFKKYATPWELKFSSLIDGSLGMFKPVVDDVGELVGHFGTVPGNFLASVQYRDADAKLQTMTFVLEPQYAQDLGWSVSYTNYTYAVYAAPNGQVLAEEYLKDHTPVQSVNFNIDDLIVIKKVLVELASSIGTRTLKALTLKDRDVVNRVLKSPPKNLKPAVAVIDDMIDLSKVSFSGYSRKMGIPEEHLKHMVAAAKETDSIAVFRANKEAAIDLISKGAVGKPKSMSIPGFKTKESTGVLTAETPEQIALSHKNGYYLMDTDGIARRIKVGKDGQEVVEELDLRGKTYWQVEKGQVIDPSGQPMVGDYDLLGVMPVKSPGRNIAVAPDDIVNGDWIGPDVKKYADAVNKRLNPGGKKENNRVMHGAQDQLPADHAGLADGTVYAVFPDGRTVLMHTKEQQASFYKNLKRKTAIDGPKRTPPPKTDKPNLRVIPGGKK